MVDLIPRACVQDHHTFDSCCTNLFLLQCVTVPHRRVDLRMRQPRPTTLLLTPRSRRPRLRSVRARSPIPSTHHPPASHHRACRHTPSNCRDNCRSTRPAAVKRALLPRYMYCTNFILKNKYLKLKIFQGYFLPWNTMGRPRLDAQVSEQ